MVACSVDGCSASHYAKGFCEKHWRRNRKYGTPDGDPLWVDFTQDDGMVSVANLDDDDEGEFIAVSYNTVRAMDTHGAVMWGPMTIPSANITSPAAIGDIDGDDEPEIIVAGGSELWALEKDGEVKWTAAVIDESGATGASACERVPVRVGPCVRDVAGPR